MELKSRIGVAVMFAADSFNRTFMELKYWRETEVVGIPVVLIVPLWNWNFNRYVDITRVVVVLIVPLWNWNSAIGKHNVVRDECFNRTFMELKYSLGILFGNNIFQVLIVPLWNWNQGRCMVAYRLFGFNRTFMELKYLCSNGEAGYNRRF